MATHPPVNPHKWTTNGGHWRPASALGTTKVVVMREPARRLGIVDTRPADVTKHHVSAPLANLRPRRERGIRGLWRRWMGWH